MRDQLNLLKYSVNDEVLATLFEIDMEAEERYDYYIDNKYETPEGWIWNSYQMIRYVTDPETGKQAQGQWRRDLIAREASIDKITELYYQARTEAKERYLEKLARLPIGAGAARSEALEAYLCELDKIDNFEGYELARR